MRNMEKQAVNRIEYLDISKGIGIILVVLGHIVYTNPYVMVWISSFHMPLFFIISGIMLAIKDFDRMDVHTNIRKKARALVIPYLWFSLAAFLFDIGNVTLGKIDSHTFLVNIISSVTFYGKSVLWFLIALFLAYTYFFILRRLTGDAFSIFFIILGAIVAYFFKDNLSFLYAGCSENLLLTSLINVARSYVRGFIVLPFLAFGYYIFKAIKHKLPDLTCNSITGKARALYFLFGAVFLAIDICIAITNWSVDTNNMILNNPVLYYLGGFIGSFAIILISKAISGIRPVRVLGYLGSNSLIIMATHLDWYFLWAGIKVSMIIYGLTSSNVLLVTFATLVTLMLCVIPITLIKRFCPFIMGKRRR